MISCSIRDNHEQTQRQSEAKHALGDTSALFIDICALSKLSIDSTRQLVSINIDSILSSIHRDDRAEDCLFDIVDNISMAQSQSALETLDLLAAKSDGSLSEYLLDVSVRMYENNLPSLITYLRSNPDCPLSEVLVDGLSMRISLENIPKQTLLLEGITKLDGSEEKEYLREVFDKVDPEKFD